MMNQFVENLRNVIENARAELLAISDDDAKKGSVDKWSANQIIGHLIDSASNNHRRFVLAQQAGDLVCAGYDQDAWVNLQHYNDESWASLVNLWASYNLHLCHVVSKMSRDSLTRLRTDHNLDKIAFKSVARDTPTTLEYFVRDYADHLVHHLRQILGPNSIPNIPNP